MVSRTPGFDGRVFYSKEPATNTLMVARTVPGKISMRLIASKFDQSEWPNLRSDQKATFKGFELESKE